MQKSIRLLVMLTAGTFPMLGYAQGFLDVLREQPISQSPDEVLEMLISTPELPPGLTDEPATVQYRFTLFGGPYPPSTVDAEADIGSFVKFRVEVEPGSDAEKYLLVNDQRVCCVFEDADRVTYQVTVQVGETAKFLWGGDIPIFATQAARQRGITIAIAHVELETGATNSTYIMRPTVRVTATSAQPY